MTGAWARANTSLVQLMARDHHLIINHTYDHRSFTGFSTGATPLTARQRRWEVEQTDRIVRRITGHTTKPYFRPPFGDYDSATLILLRRLGYRYVVMWTVDSGGWQHLSPATILQRCLTTVRPGGIIVMHVGSQSQDAAALQPLIRSLKRQRYHFVTVAQLLHAH
jgi:peptidoglycan/xylan/chitin deacetylase (PgdA/CDA1 family)